LGTGVVGWLDPFSLLVRSVGLSVLPATNYALQAGLGALEHSRFGFVQTIGGALHYVLGSAVLSFRQPYFRQGIWLGLLFIFILALNFRVTRFWCRALCPLGALLGTVSRWSLLGLDKDPSIAMTAIVACYVAREATIPSAVFPGGNPSVICA
jgi:hypothetical protein